MRREVLEVVLPAAALVALDAGEGEEDFIGDFEPARRIDHAFQFGGINALPLFLVLDHPDLFEAYPGLADVMVQIMKDPLASASYREMECRTKVIRLTRSTQMQTLLHEIQHGIQSIEGFAQGGTVGMFNLPHAQAVDCYVRLAGEVEARDVERRQHLDAAARRQREPACSPGPGSEDLLLVMHEGDVPRARCV